MSILDYIEKMKEMYEGQEPRNMYADGQLVQNTADGSRPGYYGEGTKLSEAKKKKLKIVKEFKTTAGPRTGKSVDNPAFIKKVKSSLNKIKKQRNNKLMFEWSENSKWYRDLQKDLGGMSKKGLNRESTNKLINQTIDEFFPNAYHGKNAIKNFRNDMVVNSFVEHLKTVGEFDGQEKLAKVLEQFEGVGDHRYENINRSWKSWIAGEFEVDGLDRAKLKKELKARGLSYDQIDNWSVSASQKRGLNKIAELKTLDKWNNSKMYQNKSVDEIIKLFEKKHPGSNFYHRVNELTMLKNTGKYISGDVSSKPITGIEKGVRSKWLKDGFGVQFQGNYSKMIKAADKLESMGKIDDAIRLRNGANKFFGPGGLITKAAGEGEHALARSFDMLNPNHQLKINSLVSGDLNQFKKWNFDIPVQRYFNEYNLAGTTKTRKKELAKLIEEHRTVLNYLTGGKKKGMVAKGVVDFKYGNTITATSDVIPIDKLKNFNVEDLIIKGKAYEDEFLKVGKEFGLVDKKGIKPEIMKSKTLNELLKQSDFKIDKCLSSGGRVNLKFGKGVNTCITGVIDEEMKLARESGDMAKFTKFGKAARVGGYLVGWADIPIELAFALPSLLAGDVQGAKRATTAGLFGWGGKKLDEIDQEKNPEVYKYFKHVQDINDWMDAFNREKIAESKLEELPEGYAEIYKKHGDKSGYTDFHLKKYNEAVAKQKDISENYIGYTDELGQEDLKAQEIARQGAQEYLGKEVEKGWKEGMDLDLFLPPSMRVVKDVLGLETKKVAPFKPDEITNLEDLIKQKGDPFYGKWWKRGTRYAAEELGAEEKLYDDWAERQFGKKDPEDIYSELPLEYASQLAALEKKEVMKDPQYKYVYRKPWEGVGYASGGLANLTRTVAPESGPMDQGLRSLYINDKDY